MSVLVDKNTKVVCQGLTGATGTFHTEQAIAYGNVYVARVAFGANPQQTLQAMREAEAYEGPSLILAYSHCIAQGINTRYGMKQQARLTLK